MEIKKIVQSLALKQRKMEGRRLHIRHSFFYFTKRMTKIKHRRKHKSDILKGNLFFIYMKMKSGTSLH